MKENIDKNNYRKYENKNYDEVNKYDFYPKFYLHYAIGTRYENIVEITKKEYKDLKKLLRNTKDAMIEVFATYSVGFYKTPETYVIQSVDKDVYYCLFNSQRYERNKIRHELERHIDRFFKQDNIDKLKDEKILENEVINRIESEMIKKELYSILTEKQMDRLYKNLILDISLVEIAKEENTDAAAILRSINRGINRIIKNLKNFK